MITLKQWNGQNITPADDAALYAHFDARSGKIYGCEVTHLGSNQIRIAAGRGMICGRQFVIEDTTVLATLADTGTMSGRLLVQVDIGNTEQPIQIITQAAATLPELTQEDLNAGGTVYQLPLATYTVDNVAVSNLVASDVLLPPVHPDGKLIQRKQVNVANYTLSWRSAVGGLQYASVATMEELGLTGKTILGVYLGSWGGLNEATLPSIYATDAYIGLINTTRTWTCTSFIINIIYTDAV